MYPEAHNAPSSIEGTIDAAYACYNSGASVIRLDGFKAWTLTDWRRVFEGIRERCDVLIDLGLSERPLEERKTLISLKPEIASLSLSHHSLVFPSGDVDTLHTLQEIVDSIHLCDDYHVKPQLEIWHSGSVWRLNQSIGLELLKRPYLLLLYFGWPGGNWSPPTVEELLHRFRLLPEGSLASASIVGREQASLAGLTVGLGGHLRVGTRDYPYTEDGVLAKDNSQLVQKAVRIGKASGKRPATPAEARKMIGAHAS